MQMISINCSFHLSFSGLPDSVLSICWELLSTQPLPFFILFFPDHSIRVWFFLNYVIVRAELIDLYSVHITGYLGFLQLIICKKRKAFPGLTLKAQWLLTPWVLVEDILSVNCWKGAGLRKFLFPHNAKEGIYIFFYHSCYYLAIWLANLPVSICVNVSRNAFLSSRSEKTFSLMLILW